MRYLILFLTVGLMGCGSIVNGRFQRIGFSSNPSGATVNVKFDADITNVSANQLKDMSKEGYFKDFTCVTPCFIDLYRSPQSYSVTVAKEGYETAGETLMRRPSGWLWGNIMFGGIIGLGVDVGNGSGFKQTPDQINVKLLKIGALSPGSNQD